MKLNIKYFFLLFLIYIGTIWSWLQYYVSPAFSYWDEMLSLLFIPLVCVYWRQYQSKKNRLFLLFLLLFLLAGLGGNVINSHAKCVAAFSDLYLNVKFFMACYAIFQIYSQNGIKKYDKGVKKHINFLSLLLIFLFAIDRIFGIFPVYELRHEIRSEQLFFPHPTFCAGAIYYILILRILFIYTNKLYDKIISFFLCVIIFFTLRFKAIGTLLLFIAYYLFATHRKLKKIKVVIVFLTVIAIVCLAYDQIYNYYFSSYASKMPRGAILITSLMILRDFFPLGTGFGTFGSYMSGVYYSPVYSMYHINHIYGMTKDNYNAITDQYWPMIGGETGVIGLISMVALWIILYLKIKDSKGVDTNYLLAGVGAFIYILISSTSESAICNPVCMPFAIIVGLVLAENNNVKQNKKDKNFLAPTNVRRKVHE